MLASQTGLAAVPVILNFPQVSSSRALASLTALTHSRYTAHPLRENAMLVAIVRRGKKSGTRLFPHLYKEDGRYHVSLTRQGPHIPLADDRDIPDYLANGYSLGMSNKSEKYNPTLIKPDSILGWK
jgi:hypothetical protein